MQKTKQQFLEFLAREVSPPPLLFFCLYVYKHLQIEQPDYTAYSLFGIGLVFMVLFKFNQFYLYSPILNAGLGWLTVVNLLLGLLATNQKWKLYLFLFIIGDSITLQFQSLSQVYLMCTSFYIAVETYRNLIFKTTQENYVYFIGFCAIFVYHSTELVIQSINGYPGFSYFTIPFTLSVGYKTFQFRLLEIRKKKISDINNMDLLRQYIILFREEIKSPNSRFGLLFSHRTNCFENDCYCRNEYLTQGVTNIKLDFSTKIQYYMVKNLFETVFKNQRLPQKQMIQHLFIDFLLDNNQCIEAIQTYFRLNTQKGKFKYFRWIQRQRLSTKFKRELKDSGYFNSFQKQFQYVFIFETTYLQLASQIKQILKQKVQFWKEVGKQSPLMIKLQKQGSQIVDRMYNLNEFYYKKIKEQENKINNFNGTILYSMYLLSTTNYKEFAQKLIKNTTRTLQSIQIHEQNKAQTFGVRILIKDANFSTNQKITNFQSLLDSEIIEKYLQLETNSQIEDIKEMNQTKSIAHMIKSLQRKNRNSKFNKYSIYLEQGFVQIIANISGSLCKLLKISKNQIIDQTINNIMPISYQERHHEMLSDVLHFQKKTNKPITKPSFINQLRQVPFKTNDNKLLMTNVSVKIFDNFDQGLSFVAVVQTINDNKHMAIASLDGQILQQEEGFTDFQLLKTNELQSSISQCKKQWYQNKFITKKKVSINFRNNNFSFILVSPYQSTWLDKRQFFSNSLSKAVENESQNESHNERSKLLLKSSSNNWSKSLRQPPIHIQITNESIPFLSNKKKGRDQEMKQCIQKMQSVFVKVDTESQASTKSSNISSIVSVLSSFSENSFVPFYNWMMVIFFLAFVIIIFGTIISYLMFGLPWDNTQPQYNPIINAISIMDIRSYAIQTISYQLDLDEYVINPAINKTKVQLYYGLDDFPNANYNDWVYLKLKRILVRFKNAVSSATSYVAGILQSIASTQWLHQVYTINPGILDPNLNWQKLPLTSIFMNYLIDIQILSNGRPFQRTIMSMNFLKDVQYLLSNTTNIKNVISGVIQKEITLNIIILVIVLVLASISIVPLFVMLKNRVKRHVQIYDLIASVDGKMIGAQIRKLLEIITIVNKSNQSSEVLKSNTINYIARKRASSDSNNQLIEGLVRKQQQQDTIKDSYSINQCQTKQFNLLQTKGLNSKGLPDQLVGSQIQKLHMRKRSGQLDLKGSQADNKKIAFRHLILYSIILISTCGVLAIQTSKLNYFQKVDDIHLKIDDTYQSVINLNLLILNTKIFFRGAVNQTQTYHDTTFINWLDKNIYADQALNIETGLDDAHLEPACTTYSTMIQSRYLFCRNASYSLLTLRQQITQSLRQAYQARIVLNNKYNAPLNMSLVPKSQLSAISQQLFYVQSLSSKLTNLTTLSIQKIQSQMYDMANQLNSSIGNYCALAIIWIVIALLSGIVIINTLRKDYFKQIIIVSFLNTQMIQNNKRVQSFLETLSKSSS